MTIEQKGIIDLISEPTGKDFFSLIISDHLSWLIEHKRHQVLVQEKVNEYLSFIEGGELFKVKPELLNKRITIKLIGSEEITDEAICFLDKIRDALANEGYLFSYERRVDK